MATMTSSVFNALTTHSHRRETLIKDSFVRCIDYLILRRSPDKKAEVRFLLTRCNMYPASPYV